MFLPIDGNFMIKSKNILITRSNPVKPDSRVEKEALALTHAGYNVKILCWDRDSNHRPSNESLKYDNAIIPIVRIGYKASFGEGLKNIVPYIKFQMAMRSWISKHKDEIDVLHMCDFDTAFFTYRLAIRKKIKVVFDIFDFLGSDRISFKDKLLSSLQYGIINSSDATIICTEERKKQIAGSHPRKLLVIHNTPSKEQLPAEIQCIVKPSDRPKVCYVGILQDGRLLKEIGDFFSKNSDIEFHIGGFGYLEEHFKELSQSSSNIFYYGRLPYDMTLSLENDCDIMLAIYDPSISNHRFAAPNKFYESLFLGKPILMVNGTGMSNEVQINDIGTLINFNIESFSLGLNSIISRKNNWAEISEKAKKLYEEKYNWDIMEKRLCQLYNEI